MKNLLCNSLTTPDGTVLHSYHRHDYKEHIDSVTGELYIIDGGLEYLRTSINTVPATYTTIYTDDPHDIIRETFVWGTYGKKGDQPLKYVTLMELTDNHIDAIIETQKNLRDYIKQVFLNEIEYRKFYDLRVDER